MQDVTKKPKSESYRNVEDERRRSGDGRFALAAALILALKNWQRVCLRRGGCGSKWIAFGAHLKLKPSQVSSGRAPFFHLPQSATTRDEQAL